MTEWFEKHTPSKWAGIVTNNPDHRACKGRHMSMSVCAREECIAKAITKVAGYTNETARFYTYAELADMKSEATA